MVSVAFWLSILSILSYAFPYTMELTILCKAEQAMPMLTDGLCEDDRVNWRSV